MDAIIKKEDSKILNEESENPTDSNSKKQIFIIGCKGIPAKYGGFETFVEMLTRNKKSKDICYHVACLSDNNRCVMYHDIKCFHIKVPEIGAIKAIYYDMAAINRCIRYCNKMNIVNPVFYVLACRIGPFSFYIKKKIEKLNGRLYVNPDGHEWMRAKWNFIIRKYWKISESFMVKHADLLICDSKNIVKYINKEYERYHPNTTFIAYGAETRISTMTDDDSNLLSWYKEQGLKSGNYYLVVGRFVPENNFETMIREFMNSNSNKKLALITGVDESYMNKLKKNTEFGKDSRIIFAGTVYNQELLMKIRENAYGYLHGHSVGGTNPSLLEALSSTKLNLLLNVGFNKEVAENGALYWSLKNGDLARLINEADKMTYDEIDRMGTISKKRIEDWYSWEYIVERYEEILLQ